MRKGLRQELAVAGIILPDILKMKHFNIGELFDRIWTISKNFERNLQRVLAGGLEEHTGEELRARLHLEPLLYFLALAREAAARWQGPIKSWTNCADECDMYLTTPVATSIKQPTKSPVDGGLPEGSLLT